MTDDDKKRLTEWLGERYSKGLVGYPYKHEGIICSNRTFTTPDDMMEVFHKLVEIDKWANFKWHENTVRQWDLDETNLVYSDWLFYNPTRFCQLAADFLKENKP